MGAILPDAPDVETFWSNVLAGRCAVRRQRGGAWEWERLGLAPWAAVVEGFAPDWRALRIPPADAEAMNPAQLHVLEAGRQALAALRIVPRERTGVWIGATGLGWQPDTGLRVRMDEVAAALGDACREAGVAADVAAAAVAEARAALDARAQPASEEPVVNSAASIAAGRLATLFDLRGPHSAVDAGFASGLAALDLACRALRDGTVDCALAGGAAELLSPAELVALDRMGVLASDAPRPFDAGAAGTAPGEGAVLFALKRLDDALRDGDTVLAVVLGIGCGGEGARAPLLAPSAQGQALAIRRALEAAGVGPETVGFVECHGTGTPLGDATEVAALAEGYAGAGSISIGSAKSAVGHLRGAAGAVGLLRAVLALARGTVPPQAGFARACPELEKQAARFSVPTGAAPLEPRGGAARARAGISASSLGGICYHAILEAAGSGTTSAHAAVAIREAGRPPAREPIAVLGLGAVLPGARDVAGFWGALVEGRSAIREIPPERWAADRYCHPDPQVLERSYTRLGAFADTPDADPRWRVPPASCAAIDPAQLLALRAAEEAVADARLEAGAWDRAHTGVFLGFMACQGRKLLAEIRFHVLRTGAYVRDALLARGVTEAGGREVVERALRRTQAALPPLDEDALPGWLGSVAAARIARRFDLLGPRLAVESACASTLAALHAAVQALRDGACDTALVGGAWADMQPEFYVGSCRFNALSATGSTPFDARASGFVPGEGAGVLVLRRLSDAERDGQRVQAIVRGVGASSDGRGKSIFAPSVEGEALAMARALEDAELPPGLVDYVECHGTGTAAGDAAEIEACTRVYGGERSRPVRVGSVKSNIGHLLGAAGAPALIKAVLALREGYLPASLHVEHLNPAIDFAAGPVEVVTRPGRWEATPGEARRAAVSGFGLGGTNVHAILEQYRPAAERRAAVAAPAARTPAGRAVAPRRILPVAVAAGDDPSACVRELAALASAAGRAAPGAYLELLARAQRTVRGGACRVAIVAQDAATLAARLAVVEHARAAGVDPALLGSQGIFVAHGPRPRVAVTFPGQGPQYPNMLRDALAAFPELAGTLDAADDAYQARCGRALRPAFFTDRPSGYAQRDEDIHCAVFAVNVALFRLLERHGLRPDALMGQSAGELAALVAAGTMSLEDGLGVVHERTASVLAIRTDDPGKMIALSCGAERALELAAGLPGYVALAADNGPDACILSADANATLALVDRAASDGIEATVLGVSHGYHSQLIAAARPRYQEHLAQVRFQPPRVEVISTITGRPLGAFEGLDLVDHLGSQFVEPVRLRAAVEELYAGGVRLFVECGPKWPLTTFVGQILGERPHVAVATIHPKVGEVEQLHRALACLFVHGAASLSPSEDVMNVSSPVAGPSPAATGPAAAPADVTALLRGIRDLIDGYLRSTGAADPIPAVPAAAGKNGSAAKANGSAHAAAASSAPLAPMRAALDPGAPAPRPAAPPADPPPSVEAVQRALIDEYARRTRYAPSMFDPALDLEAELGIDTVKQVAVLGAVRQRFQVPLDPKFRVREANTIAKAAAWLAARAAGSRPAAAPPPPTAPADPPARTAVLPPRVDAAPAAPAATTAGASPCVRGEPLTAVVERVRRMLLDEYVRRTHYPEAMLDPDRDLEAELAIDTVRQVAVLGAVRERLGLPPDPRFKLRDANTIAKAAEVLARRLVAEPHPPSGPGPGGGQPHPGTAPAATVAALAAQVSGATTPPRASAAPPVNAAAAAPAASAADAVPAAPEPPSRSAVALAAGATVGTVGRLLGAILATAGDDVHELTGIAVGGEVGAAIGGEPLVEVTRIDGGAMRVEAAIGGAAAEALVRLGRPEARVDAPPELLAAIAPARRERAAGGDELRAALAPVLGDARGVLAWARSDGFMSTGGGAFLPEGPVAARLGALLAASAELASFAWLGLTGAPHAVSAIASVRILAVPAAGADIGLHVKMIPPENGLWRADVHVVCGGTLLAEIRGLAGTPVRAASPAESPADAAAGRAWRRFCRRMRAEPVSEDVA
jgi:acyl transferase domain-containing protein